MLEKNLQKRRDTSSVCEPARAEYAKDVDSYSMIASLIISSLSL